MKKICDLVEEYTILLEEKESTRKEIEQRMNESEGLEYKVAYMIHAKGMTLPEIAAHLGYSYGWIRQLSMKTSMKKRKTRTQKYQIG
jgi:hypothetical protein